ncbi:MAG TPA: hypothetical protein VHU87_14435 [Rhizomicrobium sp.]|jgi:hypothetical protein|nr:hypothetical protein [Rhizomicrobium sp.]
MPRTEDFRVRSLAAWQDHVASVSPAAHGEMKRYLFHAVGANLTPRFGRAMMLKSLRDVPQPLRAPLRETLKSARLNCAPSFVRVDVPRGDGTNATWCDLILPLYEGDMPGGKLIFASYKVEEEGVEMNVERISQINSSWPGASHGCPV